MRSSKSTCVRPGAWSGRSQRCFGSMSSGRTILGSGRDFPDVPFFGMAPPRPGILSVAREAVDDRGVHSELAGCGVDLLPGGRVDRDAVLLALRPRLALRIAGDAQLVEARRHGGISQGSQKLGSLAREQTAFLDPGGIDEDREHAVPDPLLRAIAALVLSAAA